MEATEIQQLTVPNYQINKHCNKQELQPKWQ